VSGRELSYTDRNSETQLARRHLQLHGAEPRAGDRWYGRDAGVRSRQRSHDNVGPDADAAAIGSGTASGEDAQAHAPMRGFGVELWVMREGKVAVWEAAFNVGRADADVGIEATLR
jgi:hypothetical protein